MINISDIYVNITIMCHPLIESITSGSNGQHSMLDFHKKTYIYEKETPGNIGNIYVRIFGKYLHSWHLVYRWMN